jgi:hypothetical protein
MKIEMLVLATSSNILLASQRSWESRWQALDGQNREGSRQEFSAKRLQIFQRKRTVQGIIENKYDGLATISNEMRCHVKDSLTRNEKFETICGGSSKSASIISFQHNTVIQYGVSVRESSPCSAWMDRQLHRTYVSSGSLVMLKNSSDAMGQARSLHCNDSEEKHGSLWTERQTWI